MVALRHAGAFKKKIFFMRQSFKPTLGSIFFALIITLFFSIGGDTRRDLARANQYQGIYVFTDCTPEREYTILGSIRPKGKGWAAMGMKDVQYENTRDGMVSQCKDDYPQADGLILHLGKKDEADAIKFK
jgi:hypothetical protein